jgi:shikimate kinase
MSNLLRGVNVFLIGMMGSGKSTVGKVLAKALNYRFFDTDNLIEKVTQTKINEIFREQGEAYFRQLETQVLGELAFCTRSVIATGGGAIAETKNWSYLHYGLIIWLDAPIELLEKRILADANNPRPLAGELATRLAARRDRYEQADLKIPISENLTPEQITLQIIKEIPSVLKPEFFENETKKKLLPFDDN